MEFINRKNKPEFLFEETIMSAIKQYCYENKKDIFFDTAIKMRFDAYAPKGFDDDIPTVIEIKYGANKSSYSSFLKRIKNFVSDNICLGNYRISKLILITLLDEATIKILRDEILIVSKNLYIDIWSENQTLNFINSYPLEKNILINERLIKKEEKNFYYERIKEKDIEKQSLAYANQLKQKLAKEKISLVIGTGLSLDYGSPSWDKLVKYLYDSIKDKFTNEKESFKKIGGDNLCVTQYVKTILSHPPYSYNTILFNTIYKAFDPYRIYSNTSLTNTCNLIGNNMIKKIITYNYDNHLEKELNNRSINYSLMTTKEDYLKNELPIYHVHGFVPYVKPIDKESIKTVILTEDDYFNLYSNSDNWQVAIQLQTFKDDICLFLGNSITDYNEKRLINFTKQKFKHHYAIMFQEGLPVEDLIKITNYFFLTYNIDIIWVKGPYEFNEMINYLANS